MLYKVKLYVLVLKSFLTKEIRFYFMAKIPDFLSTLYTVVFLATIGDTIDFWKALSSHSLQTSVSIRNNNLQQFEKHISEHQLFLVDLDCYGSRDILSEV